MDPLTAIRTAGPLPWRPELDQAGALRDLPPLVPLQPSAPSSAPSFGQLMDRLVQDVSAKQHAGAESVRGLLAGENVPLHHAMIAMEEASVSFQLMVEVRNKLLESYQELMRMQV